MELVRDCPLSKIIAGTARLAPTIDHSHMLKRIINIEKRIYVMFFPFESSPNATELLRRAFGESDDEVRARKKWIHAPYGVVDISSTVHSSLIAQSLIWYWSDLKVLI